MLFLFCEVVAVFDTEFLCHNLELVAATKLHQVVQNAFAIVDFTRHAAAAQCQPLHRRARDDRRSVGLRPSLCAFALSVRVKTMAMMEEKIIIIKLSDDMLMYEKI